MADISSITALITAAGSVIGLANKANSVEANQKVLDLQKTMADVQKAIAELFEENHNLKEENRKLSGELEEEGRYPMRQGVRWKKRDDETEDDGPFCPICFATKKTLMPLRFRTRMTAQGILSFMCPEPHPHSPALGRDMTYHIEESSLTKGRYRIEA